jgi:heme-binding protein
MSRRLKQGAIVLVVVLAAAQLIRPSRANPPIEPGRTIQAHETTKGVAAVFDRSCGDCHSNATVWRWYTQVAPLSWLMASAVRKGRDVVNFSEWASYSPEQQRILLSLSCQDASEGKMPGPYVWFRSETRLSAEDIATICAAARQAEARPGGVTR